MSTPVVVHLGARELTGVAREGESWAAAARRVAASATGEPVARDLSGEAKHFAIDHDLTVVLRPMTRGDLPLVTRWRQAPHVHRWWQSDGEPTEENVAAQYGPDIDGMTPTRIWVVEANGRSVGFVQDYRLADYPEYALLTPDPKAIGVDYAIGDEQWLGPRHRHPDALGVVGADPAPLRRRHVVLRRPGPPQRGVAADAGEVRLRPGDVVRRAAGRREHRHGGRLQLRRGPGAGLRL